MPILAMETQASTDMANKEIREERSKDLAEENKEREFLKNLHNFMRNRDTPIERIPNLGFKQIDLYVMFKAVEEHGGYYQVTAQQMWKQVYNTLGGNPRSTSAATCTRRHYEKLLLPFECNLKGIAMNLLPQHQPKPFPFGSFTKDDIGGQRAPKRRMLSIGLQQGSRYLESDPRGTVFPLPLAYPPFYHPNSPAQAPHIPILSKVLTSNTPPTHQPWFPFQPCCPNTRESIKEPLERLRLIAEQYKTSSGYAEPLNLSVKAPRKEVDRNPVSSFAPPASSKNPKFLNKPSSLYTPQSPRVRSEEPETQDDEEVLVVEQCPLKDREAYMVDIKAITTSGSPRYSQTQQADAGTKEIQEKPRSPQTDFIIQQTKEPEKESPEVRELNLAHLLPSLARENGGKMEIEIPLSLLHNWLKLCGSKATVQGLKQQMSLLSKEDQGPHREVQPTNLTAHMNSQHQSLDAEDLRMRKRKLPSPLAPITQASPPQSASQSSFSSYKRLPSGGFLENASSCDVYQCDQRDISKSYTSRSQEIWDTRDQKSQALPSQVTNDIYYPRTHQRDFGAPKSYDQETILGRKGTAEMNPSALLMLGSGSAPMLQLTTEEVLKLKRIISSS